MKLSNNAFLLADDEKNILISKWYEMSGLSVIKKKIDAS